MHHARWLDLAWSRSGMVLLGLGALWAVSAGLLAGVTAAAIGLGLVV